MRNSGFSLVELVVVVAIFSILLSIATISFNNWTVKQNIEKQTKELVSDINDLRLRAMYSKKRHIMNLMPRSYTFKRYSSEGEAVASTLVFSKSLSYPITYLDGTSVAGKTIEVDERGFTNNIMTLAVDSANDKSAFNCVVIHNGRTNIGVRKGNACDYK